jgi:hypothetical protein
MGLSPKLVLALVGFMWMSTTALAQSGGTGNNDGRSSVGNSNGTMRRGTATHPSNNPFQNPIGQGVPPAASVNGNLNNGRTMTGPAGTVR